MSSGSPKKQAIITQKDFNLVLRVIKSNWWIPLTVIPILYGIGTFYIYRLTSVYQVSTQILLQNNDAYYKNNVLTDANFYGAQTFVDNSNEKRVIQSYDLLNNVVSKLKDRLEVSYFIVGKVRTTELFGGMPFKVQISTLNPNLYETTFDFKFKDTVYYEIEYFSGNEKITKQGKFNEPLIDLDFNLTINKTDQLNEKQIGVLNQLFYQFVIHSTDYLISRIRSDISIENPDYTNILEVSLKDIIPDRARIILDSLNQEYLYSKLKFKYELNEKTIDYIDRQIEEISSSLKASVDTLQLYKRNKSIINLEWEEQDFLAKIGHYDNERSETQLQLKALNDLEKYIIEDKDPQFLPPTVYITEKDGFMSKAVTDLYTKQIELNRIYNVATDVNPLILDYVTSIKKIKQDLLIYINNVREATKQKVQNINTEISKYIGEAKAIPPKKQDLLGIQRNLNVNEAIYNFLLEKKANTRIARASIVPDAKIIERPRNVGEKSPDRNGLKRNFLSLGFAISLIIIFIRSAFFTKIKDVEHLKELTTLPLLGVFPLIKKSESDGIIVEQTPNSMIAEAFRNFRTNLQYSNVDASSKTFLITSFLPGEGKTFTSTNLAAILARSGKRTILLELDLHKPRIYKRFDLPDQQKGITTYITGNDSIEDIIVGTPIPNLSCMFAGPVPPNPSEFVLSERMRILIDYAKEHFDYVIIDTPPAGLLSDSVYLIQYVDSSIFVLNTRTSTKKVISFIEGMIDDNKLNNINLVLNGAKGAGRRYYYSGYGYNYGYGYGYGYGKGSPYKK